MIQTLVLFSLATITALAQSSTKVSQASPTASASASATTVDVIFFGSDQYELYEDVPLYGSVAKVDHDIDLTTYAVGVEPGLKSFDLTIAQGPSSMAITASSTTCQCTPEPSEDALLCRISGPGTLVDFQTDGLSDMYQSLTVTGGLEKLKAEATTTTGGESGAQTGAPTEPTPTDNAAGSRDMNTFVGGMVAVAAGAVLL